ncbi:MAG: MBL fold metallo-hydrolase, partial [Solirubrobacterales bacterium]|nr:MBL fold metallo-hydrolase [Solirubrobacterales bacterium]
AASGQNVMLLVALALPALAALGLSRGPRLLCLLALIGLYVPLAGAEAPIQRAGVMAAAGLVATLAARPASRWYALALAAAVTLAVNPEAWRQPGWQLSFAAVAGILVAAGPIARRLGGLPRPLAEGVGLTVAATAATAPLVGLHFGELSLVALPANVAALALVAPIMWLGTLRGVLGQLPAVPLAAGADRILELALGPLLAGMERIAAAFADLPHSTARVAIGGPLDLVVAYASIALVALAARRLGDRSADGRTVAAAYVRRLPRGRRAALVACAVAVAALVSAHALGPDRPPASLTVDFLDVGQGDATLVRHPDGSAVLFDGGPPEGGVARLLRRAGVRRLSALVLTHASRDHHGGLLEVVRRFPVDLVLDGGDGTRDRDFQAVLAAAHARGVPVRPALAPLAVRAGALRIDVLSPPPRPPGPPPQDPNPRAVVAVVASAGFGLLLSGDAESDALAPLALPPVDALKVPHHGSADPGLGELLDRLRPAVAAIPVGENSYGHPAPSTLTALRRAAVPTWRTDLHGTITLSVDRGRLTVDPEHGDPVAVGP